ncbi:MULTISPECIES: ABC transporter permease [Brevibacillus]|uniref:ABC transporter permease n=1 Tax=Brevibacillus TaxID=55080 RepID=UPI00203CCA79|nr:MULTISPECIES: ABC transporter permease [Brevibacillus]MCM3080302.1 ABC transporter permease [Brevibacillus invocatus]MCM3430445.1 ABC transporter permease [Brevibacillus invocatus]MDH4615799.1 ABC transporter permease [Brevibacillus sp. AY1]
MQSKEIEAVHQRYLKKEGRTRSWVFITQILLFLVFIGLWEVLSRTNIINSLIFSYPSKIIALLWTQLAEGSLLPHVGMTVWETVVGFVLGTLIGTVIATVIWWSPFLSRVLEPYLVIANSMPKVALGPVFIVLFGPGLVSVIAMGLAISVIITTINIYTSFREVNPNFVKVVQTLGGNKRQIFTSVILPATIPTILATLKVNVGLSWVGVIVGEFLVSQIGLGYLIIYGFQVFNFTLVMMSLAIIAVVATLMYQGVAYLERRLTSQFK